MKRKKKTDHSWLRSRERGGASHPCPVCDSKTRVQKTWRKGKTVHRIRICPDCSNKYETTERRA